MRRLWLAAGTIATGGSIWATHFVAMLAFQPGLPVGYDAGLTILSIVIAVVMSGVGLTVALRGGTLAMSAGGALVGVAIGAMHYTGMAALRAPADLMYDVGLVVASLIIGITCSGAALGLTVGNTGLKRRASGALLLTLGICGLHFTGMGATSLYPNPLLPAPEQALAPVWLAVAVAGLTILILALSLAGSIVDQRIASRAAHEAARLRASEARFRQLADVTFEGIVIHAEGCILDVNRAMVELLGWKQNELVGRQMVDLFEERHREAFQQHAFPVNRGEPQEAAILHADGTALAVEIFGQMIEFDGKPALVMAVRDIRERKEAEARILHMAHHDLLTQLPNRALFTQRLEQALSHAKLDGSSGALLYLDLDRFKAVNDSMGHPAGDALLQDVARRLLQNVREHDTVARLSGDEFVVLQTRVTQPEGAQAIAKCLLSVLGKPFELDGQQALIGASIGIAIFPQDADTGEALLRNADTALYRAKRDGRGTFRFFEAEMDARLQERRHLERDLQQALSANLLTVHFQALGDCTTQEVLGYEALVRWNHPQRGPIPPTEFIPLAEECGLIIPLGDWVLRTACREAMTWPANIRVAVNLSPVQFKHGDLPARILAILRETGLPPERLELEITESVMIDDTALALTTLNKLKDAGIRISLDDFGTGYSSLSYLQKFSFDKIKIDRSFVWEMPGNENSRSIVRAIIALAHSLQITVIAEGVETEEQLNILRVEACNQIQGYLLGRPEPADMIKVVHKELA